MRPLITGLVSHPQLMQFNTVSNRKKSLNSPFYHHTDVILLKICRREREREKVLNFTEEAK